MTLKKDESNRCPIGGKKYGSQLKLSDTFSSCPNMMYGMHGAKWDNVKELDRFRLEIDNGWQGESLCGPLETLR